MTRLEKKHPLAIRWFHWINFPVLFIMIGSGLIIYWANDILRIGFGAHTLLAMKLPDKIYDALHISHRLASGMAWHFAFMWVFAINGLLYVLYTAISGEWRELLPNRHSFAEALEVVKHDLGLRKEPLPPGKFNAAQRIAYTSIIVMGFGSLVTGIAIYKSVQFSWLTALCGGFAAARFEHFWLTMGYVAFFFVHVGQVAKAGWNNFRAMVTGYAVVSDDGERSHA